MLIVIPTIIAIIWFGVGACVGWGKAKKKYAEEMAHLTSLEERGAHSTTIDSLKRSAKFDAVLIFLKWTVLGIFGAVISVAAYLAVFLLHISLKEHKGRK